LQFHMFLVKLPFYLAKYMKNYINSQW
jgi:hypothetical protein